MRRSPLILAALSVAGLAMAAAPATARDGGIYYRAELAQPAGDDKVIAKNMLWRCNETRCAAAKSRSRDVVACKRLAKKAGEVVRFSVGGVEMDAATLAQCNA
ncbi:CC_3452 family protein [Paraurantiacibacter namhicola]|uniref:Uncharacterized protein n=1 Tax=Paraurantiacibacter namhicola TaxID=645517 RepID=A0A1C7D4M0_9SPHN|nr:hypothetical protein [Paraurantiacibacter namhicola]ANU06407.1 hypothetical protein A6F65_00079 [Paraurantiacibacter namhicola]